MNALLQNLVTSERVSKRLLIAIQYGDVGLIAIATGVLAMVCCC